MCCSSMISISWLVEGDEFISAFLYVLFTHFYRGMDGEGTSGSSTGLEARILSTFLNELDGIYSSPTGRPSTQSGVLLLVACTDINALDEALVRPGRLQHHIYLGHPTPHDIISILKIRTRHVPIKEDVDFDSIARELMRRVKTPSCSHIEKLCSEAMYNVIRKYFHDIADEKESEDVSEISNSHFQTACSSIFPVDEHHDSNPFVWSGTFETGFAIS